MNMTELKKLIIEIMNKRKIPSKMVSKITQGREITRPLMESLNKFTKQMLIEMLNNNPNSLIFDIFTIS